MDNESNRFLQKLEEENNGKILFKTYALYPGKSGGKSPNLGGLLYIVGELLVFEDFEKQGGMMQFLIKRKEKYEKTKFSLPIKEIKSIYTVTRTNALKAISSRKSSASVPPAGGLGKLFNRTITQILLNDGSAYYFELIDEKPLKEFIGK